MQLARWPSSRVLTSVLTPSQVDRNRVTSFIHSLKPARYFPNTVGSVFKAAAEKTNKQGEFSYAIQMHIVLFMRNNREYSVNEPNSEKWSGLLEKIRSKTHKSWDTLVQEIRLTGHLSPLEVPEMLHRHLQDVRLLQFGVSGALRRWETHMVRITRSPSLCLTRPLQLQVKESIYNQDYERVLTSFLSASRIRVFSCPKLSLILALLLFSIMGLDDYRN